MAPSSPGTAAVVGAGSEIGSAVAAELAGLGYGLDLWGRDPDRLAAASRAAAASSAARAGEGNPPVRTRRVDLTDPAEITAAAADAVTRPVTAVVYAAGLFDWGDAHEADPDTWDRLLTVNLAAAMRVSRALLPALIAAAPSALVLIGSGGGLRAYPHNPAYVASKHGLAGFARATFLDVRAHGVKVTLVSPGPVAAGASLASPAGRQRPETLLRPADVAAAVRFAITMPAHACVPELELQPQLPPESDPAG